MKVHEFLTKDKWSKGSFARDAKGRQCEVSKGVTFCVNGALVKIHGISDERKFDVMDLPEYCLLRQHVNQSVGPWNDANDYETIIKTLKELDI